MSTPTSLMRRTFLACAGLALMTSIFACERTSDPVDPVWGKQPCAHCAMLVGDRRYAAEVVAHGERLYFDDFGCMVLWSEAHKDQTDHAWVRDETGVKWLDANTARYVHGARTPMDFGFTARPPAGDGSGTSSFAEMRGKVLARDGGER